MGHAIITEQELEEAAHAAARADIAAIAQLLTRHQGNPQLREHFGRSGYDADADAETNAMAIVAHAHYFNTWDDFIGFMEQAADEGTAVNRFEQAVDAVVTGHAGALRALLAKHPELVGQRSLRNHHATLLNYVGANGTESYRQRTPPNAVEIAQILLDAGAAVDTMARLYRGTTTLGLVATSVHPVVAGVQAPLLELLIKHCADPNQAVAADYTEGSLILACLANGRPEPVAWLAAQGARVDLEAAGGIGDLDKVKTYFNADGSLKLGVAEEKLHAALCWACNYGHQPVVAWLLERGTNLSVLSAGMMPLHSAVLGGHIGIIKLLLANNAPLETRNYYDGTVLGQALWGAYHAPKPHDMEVIDLLLAAGAEVHPGWERYIAELRNPR